MGQRDEHLAMRGEGSAQSADSRANLDQFRDLRLGVAAGTVEHRDIELLELRLDLVEGSGVARHDPWRSVARNDAASRTPSSLPPSASSRKSSTTASSFSCDRDDEVLADQADDRDGLARGVALGVRDGDRRDPDVRFGLFDPARGIVAEPKRFGISSVQSVANSFSSASDGSSRSIQSSWFLLSLPTLLGPSLDLLAAALVEQIRGQHRPSDLAEARVAQRIERERDQADGDDSERERAVRRWTILARAPSSPTAARAL